MEGQQMKPIILFFFGALLASGLWFYCFGKGRAQMLGQQTDQTNQIFFVLMAGGMSALGEVVIRAYAPVRHLRAKARLLGRWIKEEKRSVTQNQQAIISIEKQAF